MNEKISKEKRRSKRMGFEYNKLQAASLFIENCVVFHPGASISAKKFYQSYSDYLDKCELSEYKVGKHQVWTLLKLLLSGENFNYLEKRNSHDLIYYGLDLRENTIPNDLLKRATNKVVDVKKKEKQSKKRTKKKNKKNQGESLPISMTHNSNEMFFSQITSEILDFSGEESATCESTPIEVEGVSEGHSLEGTLLEPEISKVIPELKKRGRPRKKTV